MACDTKGGDRGDRPDVQRRLGGGGIRLCTAAYASTKTQVGLLLIGSKFTDTFGDDKSPVDLNILYLMTKVR